MILKISEKFVDELIKDSKYLPFERLNDGLDKSKSMPEIKFKYQ